MHFEKITREQWTKDVLEFYGDKQPNKDELKEINDMYDAIQLPQRATKNSAGYDFFIPANLVIPMEKFALIPTGIRWVCDEEKDKDKVLQLYPRSGLGFKTSVRLANTVGIIDADYYNAENEGHVMVKMYNPLNLHSTPSGNVQINQGEGFVQGIITQYYTCDDEEEITTERTGGMGSTNAKEK